MLKYTKELIERADKLKREGLTWKEVERELIEEGEDVRWDTLRKVHKKYSLQLELGTDEIDLASLRRERSARKASTLANKRLRIALDEIEDKEDFLEQILTGLEDVVETIVEAKNERGDVKTFTHTEGTPMTLELMLSDLHFGKRTSDFNEQIARNRMRQLIHTVIKEIELHSTKFNIEKVVVFLGGDIIESATMHGEESRAGCEYGNPKQVVTAIDILMNEMLIPLTVRGISIDVIGICGNHDRTSKSKTYVDRAEEAETYTIYNGLRLISEALGLNVKFILPESTYCAYNIYQSTLLYEHGDEVKGTSKQATENQISKRQKQLGKLIDGLRMGHTHEYLVYDRGRVIVNGSLCGSDGYSDTHGFTSHAMQVLNFYCPSDRPSAFYKSFPIYLD